MIRIDRLEWFERPLRTRLPFRYGIAVMTEVPHVWVNVHAVIDGERVPGRAADHLPPKWFTKNPDRPVDEEIDEMRDVLRQASAHAAGLESGTFAALVEELYRRQASSAKARHWPPLLANFGCSLVERALLDAYCRGHGQTLHDVVRSGALGLDLGAFHPELAGSTPADWLPERPLPSVTCRHTVGLADPLEEDDVDPTGRPADGLPVALASVIRAYQLRHFKIKVSGSEDGLERLQRAVAVIHRETGGDFAASLDGNETFLTVEAFQAFWARAQQVSGLTALWPRLLFVEQPFARSIALSDAVAAALSAWEQRPRLLIDESGAESEDLRRALAAGYVGTSHKNCKGVLHGIANACRLAQLRREQPQGPWMMSGEDLANVGPVALPQDLAVQALLGNASVERNGHHYFSGLAAWPEDVQAHVLEAYPDLYQKTPDGWPSLRITSGQIELAGVNQAAFGGPWAAWDAVEQPWLTN